MPQRRILAARVSACSCGPTEPSSASTFAFRDERMAREPRRDARIAGGYGALINFLVSECRRRGATIHLFSVVTAIEESGRRVEVHCKNGSVYEADAAIITVPLPILPDISLPHGVLEKVKATTDIGFGNVVKILLRFSTKWWTNCGGRDLGDLSFLFSNATVPVWWTQRPAEYPVLTGWFAGPKADTVARHTQSELVDMGLDSLTEAFNLPLHSVTGNLVTSHAMNWGIDAFARGAYSYATPKTREAQIALQNLDARAIFLSGEALYGGQDMGTVEAALANGTETAQAILTLA